MIQAVSDKIVLESMRVTKSKHGIIIPDTGSDTQGYGKVLSVGDEVPKCFEIGQILIYHPRAGMDTIMDESMLKIVKHEEVWGILTSGDVASSLEPIVIGKKAEKIVSGANRKGGVIVVP